MPQNLQYGNCTYLLNHFLQRVQLNHSLMSLWCETFEWAKKNSQTQRSVQLPNLGQQRIAFFLVKHCWNMNKLLLLSYLIIVKFLITVLPWFDKKASAPAEDC